MRLLSGIATCSPPPPHSPRYYTPKKRNPNWSRCDRIYINIIYVSVPNNYTQKKRERERERMRIKEYEGRGGG